MQIPVLVEPVANNGYRARSGEPLPLSAEGPTAQDAMRNLEALVAQRLKGGAQMHSMQVPATEHPWRSLAGIYAGDPLFEEWREIMAERRRLDNAGLEAP